MLIYWGICIDRHTHTPILIHCLGVLSGIVIVAPSVLAGVMTDTLDIFLKTMGDKMDNLISEVDETLKRNQRKNELKIAKEDLIRQAIKRYETMGDETGRGQLCWKMPFFGLRKSWRNY